MVSSSSESELWGWEAFFDEITSFFVRVAVNWEITLKIMLIVQ